MDEALFLKALTAFFVIIDPVGMSLLFHSLTHSEENSARIRLAIKACAISCSLLIFFGIYGEPVLAYLGISIEALKISGGILLFYTAFRMVTSRLSFVKSKNQRDIAVFPLSIPLLAGPGSLTVAILLFSDASSSSDLVGVMLAAGCILLLTCLLMMSSRVVSRIIPQTGDEILRRFLGVLLAALAIQFVLDGLAGARLGF